MKKLFLLAIVFAIQSVILYGAWKAFYAYGEHMLRNLSMM